jgi:sirohydrochlorin cobaltochelatase
VNLNPVATRPALRLPRSGRSGLILVGHGTRDEEGTRQFFELANVLAQSLDPMPVAPALLEFQSPTIAMAWTELAEQGVTHIHVAPLLLFAAGHAKQDIPSIIAESQLATPHITWSQSRPLSRHPALVALAVERGQTGLATSTASRSQRACVFVGRGSHDPCAQADTRVLAHIVGHRLGVACTSTAFYAMAKPDVPTVLDETAASGLYTEILVQPHLLFAGRLHQAIVKQVDEAAARHPHVRFMMADYLGPEPRVAQALAELALT